MARRQRRRGRKQTRSKTKHLARGIIEVNPRGFAFVKTADGEFFIPASKVGFAFDGDLVEVAKIGSHRREHRKEKTSSDSSQRIEGRVVRVIERAHDVVVGRYEIAEPFGVVVPEDPHIRHDIFTQLSANPDIEDGSIVKVQITDYPARGSAACGRVIEVLGKSDDLSLKIERIIARHGLETTFSEACINEANLLELSIDEALENGYRDIRDRITFTIDPVDAKDFDDAISIEPDPNGHEGNVVLGVHIADVSAYVKWNSAIDMDARKRSTSTYLPDRVIPMLPERLSNDLCSLVPGEDRLCMSVDIYLNKNADIVGFEAYPAVMRSNARLTYDEVQKAIDAKNFDTCNTSDLNGSSIDTEKLNADLMPRILKAVEIAKKRECARAKSGGIDFDTKEAKVVLDKDGHPNDVVIREKTDATQLVEEAMILANEVIATHLEQNGWPCAYRIHERPAADALKGVSDVLQEFKWYTQEMKAGLLQGDRSQIQAILAASSGRVEHEMVTMLLLRAMMRAIYSPDNAGHYGLGLSTYCHFTSPIRRYPDLLVHRFLRASLTKRFEKFDQMTSKLPAMCEHVSTMERAAEFAAMDSQKAMMVEYMASFIGQRFHAVISGVTTHGIYVKLENCAEGIVSMNDLGHEYFIFDPIRKELKGSDTQRKFRLGAAINVVLIEADTRVDELRFALAE